MPPPKPGKQSAEHVSSEEKIARLLGLFLTKSIDQKNDQVLMLRSAGFDITEVATMLGMTANHVNVATFKARRSQAKKKPKK